MNRIISLFLFIFVANYLTAQYNSPIKNKVTLGVQTTADGLIYRGVAATDTLVRKPSIDTMAYMVLDTTTNIIWHYKKATSNAWLRLNLLPSDTASMLTNYWRSGRFSGTLPVANGGTNLTSFTNNGVLYASSTSALATGSALTFDGSEFTFTKSSAPFFRSTESGTNITSYFGSYIVGLYLGTTTNHPIQFIQNSSEKMRLNSTGLGIGTTTPDEKLHVVGNGLFTGTIKSKITGEQVIFADNGGTNRMYMQLQNTSGTFYAGIQGVTANDLLLDVPAYSGVFYTNNQDMAFGTNFTRRLMIKADGKIGIATSNPTEPLHVVGNGLFTGSVTANSLSLTTPLAVANGGTNRTTMPAGYILHGDGTSVDTAIGLFWDRSLRYLGVGTTSPALDITINSSSSVPGMAFTQSYTNTSAQRGGFYWLNNANSTVAAIIGQAQGDNVGTGLEFTTRPVAGSATVNMVLRETGRLGIGTVSPTEKLHVNGNGLFTGNVGIGSATPTTSGSGITFPATQSASTDVNTLDDYEEGTWTPTIRGSTVSGTYTPSTTTAFYTKIGNVVTVWCFVDMRGGTATGGTGVLLLESLPFNYKAGSAFAGNTRFDNVDYPQTSSHGTFAARNTSGASATIIFQISRDNADTESIPISGFTTSSLLTTNFSYTTN